MDLWLKWLGIKDDYRTLIEADNLDIVEWKIDESDEEVNDAQATILYPA